MTPAVRRDHTHFVDPNGLLWVVHAKRRLLFATSVSDTLRAFLLPYAEHYRQRGWRVDAAAAGVSECEVCADAFDAVHDLPWTRRPSERANFFEAPRALRALVRREAYDLVHAHDPIAGFVTRFALRRARARGEVKVIVTAHGFHFFAGNSLHRNVVFGTLEWLASRWLDAQVVINREDVAAVHRWRFPGRARTLYMPGIGVDTSFYDPARVSSDEVAGVRQELGLAPGQALLLIVGELNPGKRHRDAVAALAASGRPQLVLACAGVGPLAAEIEEQARTLGVGERVRLLGFRRDVPALLRASIGLVLPSEREGLPRCIMEASCLERPVIATRIRGVTELVTPATGILTEVGDVAALAAAMARLVDHPQEAAALGRAGPAAMRPFDLKHVLALHDELYDRVLGDADLSATSSIE